MATVKKASSSKNKAAPAKRAAGKKATPRKTAARKVVVKKAVAKKAVAKTVAKKVPVKLLAAVKKAAAKKAAARKAVAKKVPARKTVAKKVGALRTAAKEAPAKRVAAPKAARPVSSRRGSTAAKDLFDPREQLGKLVDDGPAKPATRGMPAPAGAADPSQAAMPSGFFEAYTGAPLTDQDFEDAARALGCEAAAVKAVAEVETAGAGFDSSNRPTILYERHVFARCTAPQGKFDKDHPDVSGFHNPYPPGGYGRKDQQYGKLASAHPLDETAALKAPSWGKFQILGENHKACGFATVQDFVKAMTISEAEHLKAFMALVRSNPNLLRSIRQKDWAGFAKAYNGANYQAFKYDTKLAAAYAKHAASA